MLITLSSPLKGFVFPLFDYFDFATIAVYFKLQI